MKGVIIIMRYDLGVMDVSPIYLNGTVLENNPCFRFVLKESIDGVKLKEATELSLNKFPLFKTRIVYDKKYYLETNRNAIIVRNIEFENRPLLFGKNTNEYPWQITYHSNTIIFEWCHCITDGVGAFDFIIDILNLYFDICDNEVIKNLNLGIESTVNNNSKKYKEIDKNRCFSANILSYKNKNFTTKCHTLEVKTNDILEISKNHKISPVTLIAPLYSKAIRNHLPVENKNHNVACSILIDERKIFDFSTMHNFITARTIFYVDKYDSMDFFSVCSEYRKILSSYCQKENMIAWNKKIVDDLNFLISIKPQKLQKALVKPIAKYLKHNEVNFGITYLRNDNLSKELKRKIDHIDLIVWHDYGESNIAITEFDGNFIVNITENYIDNEIIDTFIKESKNIGLNWKEKNCFEYTQANYKYNQFNRQT